MDEARHDSEPANPEDDPLRRIAALERRVAVLTRENERLETFLAILRHKTFGRSSEKMSPDQLSLLDTAVPGLANPGEAEAAGEDTIRQRRRGGGALCPTACHPRDPARQHAVPVLQPGDDLHWSG